MRLRLGRAVLCCVAFIALLSPATAVAAGGNGPGAGLASPDIVGGTAVPPAQRTSQWPYVVAILFTTDDGIYECTGSQIGPSWVLTAGHCALGMTAAETTVVFDDDITAALDRAFAGRLSSNVDHLAIKPGFAMGRGDSIILSAEADDVSLLHLRTPRPLTAYPPLSTTSPTAPTAVTALGYGMTSGSDESNTGLREVGITVTPAGNHQLEDADGRHGTCNGDSGGPIVDANGTILGTTTYGDEDCSVNSYFTDLATLHGWIQRYLTDTTPPVIGSMRSVIMQTSLGSYPVPWSKPTAHDAVSGAAPVSCDHRPGASVGVGTRPRTLTVTCRASDAADNTATRHITLTTRRPTTKGAVMLLRRSRARVTAGGYKPGTKVAIRWGGRPFATTSAASNGRIGLVHARPARRGTLQVVVTGTDRSGAVLIRVFPVRVR